MDRQLKILLSGGGTGGHIFPAVAIAQEIRKRFPEAQFLFIGANGKMEMEKVPQAGFPIEGLNMAGFDRGNLLKNVSLPFKLISSLWKARKIIRKFQPDVAIGTGGFASGPALFLAARAGIPTFLQEQNSLPGKTNIINAFRNQLRRKFGIRTVVPHHIFARGFEVARQSTHANPADAYEVKILKSI